MSSLERSGYRPVDHLKRGAKFVASHLASETVYQQEEGSSVYTYRILAGKMRGMSFSIDHGVETGLGYAVGKYERDVTQVFDRFLKEGDSVFDIGAHVGYLSMYMAKSVGREGKVYSFEPVSQTRKFLERNISDNNLDNITVLPYAISSVVEDLPFTLNSRSSYENHILRNGYEEGVTTLSVPTVTIDSFVHAENVQPSLIKVDVEGEELEALLGATETLREYKPVVIAEVRNEYCEAIVHHMDNLGYTGKMISPTNSSHYRLGTPNILFT